MPVGMRYWFLFLGVQYSVDIVTHHILVNLSGFSSHLQYDDDITTI